VNKSERITRDGHVARMGEMRNVYIIFVQNLNGRNHSEDLSVDGKVILEWILKK